MNFSKFITILQGFTVGVTMMVPGVSGGSMAMILGAYDRLISSVSSFMKHKKDSFIFLLLFSVPALAGMVLLAEPLLNLIEVYEMPMMYLFMGAVAGGIPMIYRKAGVQRISLRFFAWILAGILIIVTVGLLPQGIFSGENSSGLTGYLLQITGGIVIAMALVLPGLSVSYMLVLLDLYQPTMEAISNMDIAALAPMAAGVLLGIVLTTRLLEYLMNRFPFASYLVILGFVLGSVAKVFPGIPSGSMLIFCPVMAVAGFLAIYFLSRKEEQMESDTACRQKDKNLEGDTGTEAGR